MRTEKQIQASRTNGAHSRGPITPEGKAVSARNAIRHGLLANIIVLSNEDVEGFKALFDMHADRLNPVDDFEISMIEEMCASYSRLRRTWAMETSIFESGIARQPPGTPTEQAAGAFCDAFENRPLALLHRYEARLHGTYQRALKEFLLLRKATGGAAHKPAARTEAPEPPARPATPPAQSQVRLQHAGIPNEPKPSRIARLETPAPESPSPPVQPELPNEPEPLLIPSEINTWH